MALCVAALIRASGVNITLYSKRLSVRLTCLSVMANKIKIKKFVYLLMILAVLLVASILFVWPNCPQQGWALTTEMRAFTSLKNRTMLPGPGDFDERLTLEALVEPGDDRGRWSEERAAKIEGYVVGVARGGIEAANCYSLRMRDTHIYIARSLNAPPRERVVVEVTPRLREWAKRQGYDWSESELESVLIGRWCRIEGWLLFDREHAQESENLSPGGAQNWRATAWEIHPVTSITVLK
jgi:hypothetical protein